MLNNWRNALPSARAVYALPFGECGHCCHIVLDDGNLHDNCVEYCRGYAEERGCETCQTMMQIMRQMSMAQRRKLYATYRDYAVPR